MKLGNPQPGINYKYYEGNWEKLPEFDSMKPVDEGVVRVFSIDSKKSPNYFGFEFKGYINIPATGVYTFYTSSDDGSNLYIGNELVVDNDLLHGTVEKKGVIALSAGMHPIKVGFFENGGDENLKVYYKGPGIKKQVIPDSVLFH